MMYEIFKFSKDKTSEKEEKEDLFLDQEEKESKEEKKFELNEHD